MEFLNVLLPVLLYIFGIILLIVLIILGIRLIQVLDKVDRLVDDAMEKASSLNALFSMVDRVTDGLALVTDKIVSSATAVVAKIFKKKKKEDFSDE